MAAKKAAGKAGGAKKGGGAAGFSAEEKAAMKEYLREKRGGSKGDGEADVLAKIAGMAEGDRQMAERVHAVVRAAAPGLVPRTWYGMPAYSRDGNVVCFFQNAGKFKARYSTLGFSDKAKLDEGAMWATSFAIVEWNAEVEGRVRELVRRAAGE
ncbi:MAG TPA: hypothetical protein VHQ47_15785 [Phycisphaerae bacterium]|nr:hypothetical protein [Phycisphaerae bacterium]